MKKQRVGAVVGLGLAVIVVACGDAPREEVTAQSTGQSLSVVRASARTRRGTGISEWRLVGSGDRLAIDGFGGKTGPARGRFEMRATVNGGVTLTATQGLSSSTLEIGADGSIRARQGDRSPAFLPHLREDLGAASKPGGTTRPLLLGQDDGDSPPQGSWLGRDEEEGAAFDGAAGDPAGWECAWHVAGAALVCGLAYHSCLTIPTPFCPIEAAHCLVEAEKAMRACR